MTHTAKSNIPVRSAEAGRQKPVEQAKAENLRAKAVQEEPRDLSDTAEFPPALQEEDGYPPEDEEEEEVEDGGSAAPTSRISFGELQFGRDYEIT